MRNGLVLWSIPLLLLIALVASIAAGEGTNVLELQDGYDKIVQAPDSITFTWVVYNNGTVPYLLEVEAEMGTDPTGRAAENIDLLVVQNYSALAPGESREVQVEISTTKATQSLTFPVRTNLTLTNMNDPSQSEVVSKTAMVHVKALFESTGNKIFGIWDNNLPSPFNTLIWSFMITVSLWVAIASVIYFVIDPLIHQLTKKTKTDLDDRIIEVTRMPIFAMIVIFGIVDSLSILNVPQEWHLTIMQLYQIFLAVILSYVAYRIFDRVVIYYAEKLSKNTDTEIDDVLVPLLHKVGIVLIPIIGIAVVLSILGVDVTLLVAGMGVIGLVVAFAVQQTLGNLFAGMQLLLDRPFKVGDIVELDSGEICEVQKIGLRSTTMYNTSDHEIIIVPNNDVVNKKVINYSRPDLHRSMSAEVGVAYGTDLDKVKDVLLQTAIDHPDVIKQEGQKPYVRLAKFSDSSVDFKLWYWVEVKNMWRVASEIRLAIYERFNENGIEIPLPQSVVSLKNGAPKP